LSYSLSIMLMSGPTINIVGIVEFYLPDSFNYFVLKKLNKFIIELQPNIFITRWQFVYFDVFLEEE